ncbi:MAG: 50S ribosomal protein L32 [bacterium]|nr:50S ribosomal protein L32 [bacterium]
MVNRMRATRAHRDNRRSHHALDAVRLGTCSNCNSKHVSHTVCTVCGFYKGKEVIDMKAKITKKAKKSKAKENAR